MKENVQARSTIPASTVAIVGAGPAGLFAAQYLAQAGFAVTIYERMPSPARKFLMAGRGGLNLTHSEDLETFLDHYCDPQGVVRRAVTAFPPSALIDWANGLGAETFVGSSGRVFPKAMKSSPLLRAWLRRLGGLGVELRTGWTWCGFGVGPTDLRFETAQGSQTIHADAAVLALGGASWPRLGSDGSWVQILERAGAGITPLAASNCGVLVAWSAHMAKHAGAPLKRIAVTCGGRTLKGEALITANGLEGGAIYAFSNTIREALGRASTQVSLDLRPDIETDVLAERLARAPKKDTLANTLRKAAALPPQAIAVAREPGALPRDPAELARRIKNVILPVTGLAGIERAISTAGGVRASSLDENLMLRDLPGVFAAGEMLDFDAPTGGYLLQAAFSTGRWAAQGVAGRLAANGSPSTPENVA